MNSLSQFAHGLIGAAALIAVAVLCSANRKGIRLRVVGAAFLVQIFIGWLVLFVPPGRWLLGVFSSVVIKVLSFGDQGAAFVFGGLVSPHMADLFPGGGAFILALKVLPQIIYISALISVLYYIRVMQYFAQSLGWVFRHLIGTSEVEALSAATTIFVGLAETPVVIKPFLPQLTRGELFTVLCSGMSSVAGGILAGYAGLGIPMEYLLTASLMAIPGGLLFAKLLFPSDEPTKIKSMQVEFGATRPANIFEAAAVGTMNGVRVAVAIGAMLISFIGLIGLCNGIVAFLGRLVGHPGWSLQGFFGTLFSPVAWAIGVPGHSATTVGGLIGQKLVFNETIAYATLSPIIHGHGMDAHSIAIATFALCGFSNFSSVAMVLAAYGSLAPEWRHDVARLAMRALLAGTLSNLMSAAIAGMFI
jgi:CNT family concentrative nucleoside transporter